MKRFISLALVAMTALTIAAQQRIYTTDGQTIRGYVVNVTDDYVYFTLKEASEPLDSLLTKEVYNIVYKNGSFDIITPAQQTTDKGSILSQPKSMLEYDGHKIMSYSGKSITESEWLALASQANVDQLYRQGKTLRRVGIPLWASGVGFAVVGGIAMLAGAQNNSTSLYVAGESLTIFATPLIVTGIPLHCVGNKKMEKSYQGFNANNTSHITLNLQSTNEGVGIALNF